MNHAREATREVALTVLAKMSLCDGHISLEEEDYLADMAGPLQKEALSAIIERARNADLAQLVGQIESYEDRFFIALRAFSMAHVDAHYDLSEKKMYEKLVDLLHITPADQALITATELAVDGVLDEEPHPRLIALFERSSFCEI